MAVIWGGRTIRPEKVILLTKHESYSTYDGSETEYERDERTYSDFPVGYFTGYLANVSGFLHKSVFNYCICQKFRAGDFFVTSPAGANVEGNSAITVKLTKNAEMAVKVAVMTSDLPAGEAQAYSAINAISAAHVIQTGSREITWTLTAAERQNIKQYGIAIAQVTPKTLSSVSAEEDKANARAGVDTTTVDWKYRNTANPGSVTVIAPSNHSVIVGNAPKTFYYQYKNEYGEPAAYLSVRFTNLENGNITQICRKQEIDIDHLGIGTFSIESDTLDVGTYRLDVSANPADCIDYFPDSSVIWEGYTVAPATANEYTVKLNPSTSAITCDGRPVPTISWTSSGQAAYQVRFGDYDSGARSGNQTSFTVPRIFADGSYPAQVRTATNAGEWSGWTDVEYVAISNSAPSGTVTAAAERFGENVRISWTSTVSSPTNYAVFRDGALIGVTAGTEFVDRFANAGSYVVYAVKNGYYRASGAVGFRAALRYDVISADGGLTYTRLKFTPDLKSQPESHQTEVSFAWFAGRRKPISMTANQKTRVKQFSYIYHKRADAEFLIDLEGREVLLKNTRGAVIYGILSGLTISDERCPVVSFSVQEIEREDEIVEYHV